MSDPNFQQYGYRPADVRNLRGCLFVAAFLALSALVGGALYAITIN